MSTNDLILHGLKVKADPRIIAANQPAAAWVRPADWLALPNVLATEQKFVALHAVFPHDNNLCSIIAEGAYTVDWGDGVVENFASGVQANHNYNYDNVALNGTLCSRGYKQAIMKVTPQAGQNLTKLTPSAQHPSLHISNRMSTGYLDVVVSGPYLQQCVFGTMNPAGSFGLPYGNYCNLMEQVSVLSSDIRTASNMLTACSALQSMPNMSLSKKPVATLNVTINATTGVFSLAGHGMRDGDPVFVKSVSVTTGLTVYSVYYVINSTVSTFMLSASWGGTALALVGDGSAVLVTGNSLSNFMVGAYFIRTFPAFDTSNVIDFTYAFATLRNLTAFPQIDMGNALKVTAMFSTCVALRSLPLLNTSKVIDFTQMLYQCISMTAVPLLDTSSGIIFTQMFSAMRNLRSVPLINTSKGNVFIQMFNSCVSLESIPFLDLSSGTDFSSMFSNCVSLDSVPLFDTSNGLNFNSMFSSCSTLKSVPLLNTANGLNFGQMFNSCVNLTTIPLLNTVNGTSFSSMFSNCSTLQEIPLLNTASGTDFSNMFLSCQALQEIPLLNTANGLNFGQMFGACTSLRAVPAIDTSNATSLNSIFSGCGMLLDAPMLNTSNVTNFQGMFNSCYSLRSVPLYDTSKGTAFGSMFYYCTSLASIPTFNTSNSLNFQSMFYTCSALQIVPALDMSKSTNNSGMFSGAQAISKSLVQGAFVNHDYTACRLSKAAIEEIFNNFVPVGSTRTVDVTGNPGADAGVSLTGTTTTGSATVSMASTAGINVGDTVTGTGISAAVAVTFTTGTNLVTKSAHGLVNDTPVSFATVVTTTALTKFTQYFVVNAATNTYQVSLTKGGAPVVFNASGSGTMLYGTKVNAINPNVSVTLSVPASAAGANTLKFRKLNTSIATIKGWAVTG
jgi:hypothetical protein